jgi:ketosteroid isomerase-like protein
MQIEDIRSIAASPLSAQAFVKGLFGAIDGQEWDALPDFFAPDCRYERPGYEPIIGLPALLGFYAHERIIASGRHFVEKVAIAEDAIVCWGRFVGRSRSGRDLDEVFTDVYDLEADRIRLRRTFFFRPAI